MGSPASVTDAHTRRVYCSDINNAVASSAGAGTAGLLRRGLALLVVGLLAGGVIGLCVGYLPRLVDDALWGSEASTRLQTAGRVEGPAGFDLTSLHLTASRDGREVGQGGVDADGRFRVSVLGSGPFDLHATDWRSWRDPHSEELEPVSEVVTEGEVRSLAWGARGVLVGVEPVPLAGVSILVRRSDEAAAADTVVYLRSRTDQVRELTGPDGVARFEGLPVRSWRAVCCPSGENGTSLVTGWRDFVPNGQQVQIFIPAGVRLFVRLRGRTPADMELGCEIPNLLHVYLTIPWRPGSDGRMAITVAPDCHSLSLVATEYVVRTERETVTRNFAAGAIAVVEDAELVLEPLER